MTESEKYFDYLKMLRKPFQKLCRLRFLQPDGTTAFSLDNRRDGNRSGAFIADGTISHNWQNGRRTNVTVTIENTDGDFDYDFNTVWFGQEIALDEGLILSDGETEFYIQQGVFLIEEPNETVQPNKRTATYNLVDKVAALDGSLGGNLEGTYQVEAGTNIFEPISALLEEDRGNGYPVDRVKPVFTEYYNNMTQELPDGTIAHMTDAPYTLTVEGGQSKWNVIEGLAAMVNAWVGYDETGALRVDPSQDDILDTDKPVEWEFSMAEAELLGMTYTVKNTEVYNDYIVVGELLSDNAQPTGRAQIFDSRSPVSIDAIGRKTIRISKAGYGTNTQCRDYANFMIKRSSISQRAVTISCSQIFHIRGNQLITLTRTDKAGNPTERHLVQGFTRPLASNGAMTITATSTQDIEVASVASVSTFRFVSPSSFTLETGNAAKNWDGTLEYSANSINWNAWDGTTAITAQIKGSEYVIYLRGTGNTKICGGSTTGGFVLTGSQIRCEGNVEILLDSDTANNGLHPAMAASCFAYLFNGNTALVFAPTLAAESLSASCYESMFAGCTGLTEAPVLPATTLANACYRLMFNGCTGLTAAPVLPATVLTDHCYFQMFQDCTGMLTPPSLPAESLATYCYSGMFFRCSSLSYAPELPATELYGFCYALMFAQCTAIVDAPALPAMTLATACYEDMFSGCTSLVSAPELPATTLADYCYFYMFSDCTSLSAPPALPAMTLPSLCCRSMFEGCTGIKVSETRVGEYQTPYRIPVSGTGIDATNALSNMFVGTGGTFTGTPVVNTTYYLPGGAVQNPYLTFSSPSSFTLSVNNATKNWDGTLESSTDAENWYVWDGTTALSGVESGNQYKLYVRGSGNTIIGSQYTRTAWFLSGSNVSCDGDIRTLLDYADVENSVMAADCFCMLFYNCTALVSAPDLPAITLSSRCYSSMFSGCTSLTSAPTTLPATTLASYCYSSMFRNCTSLTSAPALPATTLANDCYRYMFGGCTSLTSAPTLPATTMENDCYNNMFYNCTSLINAPQLSATTLAVRCYQYMFYNCSSLTGAPNLPALILASQCYEYMFRGCSALINPPTISATTLAGNCCTHMFYECTSLTEAPALSATTLASSCYTYMFYGCTSLTSAPDLLATTLAGSCYSYMFAYCTSLTSAPILPATILASNCYEYMFYGCTALTAATALPATTLEPYCYRGMFGQCEAMTQLPLLPATTLKSNCYYNMFSGCTGIKLSQTQTGEYQTAYRIPSSGTGTTATNAMSIMFYNTGGTFTGTPTINTTYYTSNTVVS